MPREDDTTYRIAIQMDVHPWAAMRMKLRYLKEELEFWGEHLHSDFALYHYFETIEKMAILCRGVIERKPVQSKFERLTDDQIARAKAFPIEKLVTFHRGKTTCPFHEDKVPSAFHGTRGNVLRCPVCNRSWNPINLLVERNGYSYRDAVLKLSSY